ncbi:SulA-like leucine-rich domain-containing protein [Vibrio sinaloensis]|uniref:50S ribosomal protein L7ae n=1 Tax=Photobacterium sp. (strain ATCC 43367) TaxID=379097 RepID=A0A0A5I494_PHOS4|nr:SulA-like leucine-rich domain-containing protein [Vibrio sinaloensis]KGY10676.1 50S ribosomal protein L7ae [Vibrio sinaloensis]KIE20676.1 50S ribosomal protein L7ae [Vibrio sinaloensis]
MIQFQTTSRSVSKFNVLAQPTQPMNIDDTVLYRLASLSHQKQWILFTAECPRPDYEQFASYNVSCKKIIQMRASQTQSEVEIVTKAIQSGNASAVVASNQISELDQALLTDLANQFQCAVFFVEGRSFQYH